METAEEGYEGDVNCQHEWKRRDNITIDTLPPIVHVTCRKCGRVEHRERSPVTVIPSVLW